MQKQEDGVKCHMGIFYGFLLCTDIDGTLYNSEKKISDENRAALQHFTAEGGLFTVATGRTPHEFAGFDRSILTAPVIASSGSLILDHRTGEALMDMPFEADGYDILREIDREYPSVIGMFAEDNHTFPRYYREEGDVETLLTAFDFSWHKAILETQTAEEREVLERELNARYGDRYVFDSAWYRTVEMHKGDKRTGVEALRRLLGERARIVICVGDHTNDIPMIRAADIGCAVANGLDVTKAAADYVTVSNEEHAMAYIIDHALAWAKEKNLL